MLCMAGLFAYAAWQKGQDPERFLAELQLQAILPEAIMGTLSHITI